MKKLSISLFLTLTAFGAATITGCGSSPGPGSGASGWDLTPTDTGFLDGNMAHIVGAWYSYGDWYNPIAGQGDCAMKGMYTADKCSMITTPIPGDPFMNAGDGKMCTSGIAAQVIDMNYSAIWGTGIGFDLNNGGTDDGGTGMKAPYDADANGMTGLAFHIDMPPTGGQMRVEFPTNKVPGTTDINAAYWGGAGANLSPFTKSGDYSFKWAEVGGPMYLTSPTPFDPKTLLSVQFHVVTNTSSTIPFNYCISNVKALHN
jgi:hypothetical protein